MTLLTGSESWITAVGLHVVSATVLGLLVVVVHRFVRHAPTRHALWLVVLLKLVTPPVLEWAVLPTGAEAQQPIVASSVGSVSESTVQATPSGRGWIGSSILLVLGLGSVAMLSLSLFRLVRFQRLVQLGRPAPPALQQRMAWLSERLGVRRAPSLRVLNAPVSPALWPTRRGVEVLFPAALLARLQPDEIDAVLAHELAHVRRRDHWTRFVELAAMVLYWWHPLAWWARRELRRSEERACDGHVARALPGGGRAYASGLLHTLSLLTTTPSGRSSAALPAIATGMNTRSDLEERLTMIITERTSTVLSPFRRGLLVAFALAVLAVVPIRADRDQPADLDDEAIHEEPSYDVHAHDVHVTTIHDADEAHEAHMHKARMLAEKRHHLEDARRALEDQAAALAHEAQAEALDHRAARLELQGGEAALEALATARDEYEQARQRAMTKHEQKRMEIEIERQHRVHQTARDTTHRAETLARELKALEAEQRRMTADILDDTRAETKAEIKAAIQAEIESLRRHLEALHDQ